MFLGSMNELGDVSEDLQVYGAKLQLQKGTGQSSVVLSQKPYLGVVDSGSDIGAITIVERTEDARMLVDSFKGAILLKEVALTFKYLMPKVETYEEEVGCMLS